ncbi:hypothetical protein P5673_008823 [Acropora cervicornis]|uniref:Uncharacterized protein n=1 Tax=Acropora cervicornis TaxID=6130 RepID=A0AAD9QTY4_ACRCE|nr:hypothetical protein P5673_008823 [Acropora cervicornis]
MVPVQQAERSGVVCLSPFYYLAFSACSEFPNYRHFLSLGLGDLNRIFLLLPSEPVDAGFKKKKNDFAAEQIDRKKLLTVVITNALERCLNEKRDWMLS